MLNVFTVPKILIYFKLHFIYKRQYTHFFGYQYVAVRALHISTCMYKSSVFSYKRWEWIDSQLHPLIQVSCLPGFANSETWLLIRVSWSVDLTKDTRRCG